jgi:hypothetical protein
VALINIFLLQQHLFRRCCFFSIIVGATYPEHHCRASSPTAEVNKKIPSLKQLLDQYGIKNSAAAK